MIPERTEVIVSGAGPVGLTLALALARRGVRTVVLERKTELDPHSRATLLHPRSLEVLASVGVLPAVVEQGQRNPVIAVRRTGDHATILSFDFGGFADTTAVPFAVALPQDRTERILLDAARATDLVDVRFGSPLQRFTADEDGVSVEVGTDTGVVRRLRGSYLVGADGAHSAVREQLGWPLQGTTYPTRAFLADVRIAPRADLADGWLADPRAASFTIAVRFGGDATGGVWRLIESAVPPDVTPADFAPRARAITERIFGSGAWQDTLWTAAYRKHERRAPRYGTGRVVLAGDAAHLNSPAGGQGLTTGLQDAHALAWRLAELVDGDGHQDLLLESYTDERAAAFDADVRPLTDAIERMETLPGWLRSPAFAAVGLVARSGLPRLVARRMAMLAPTAARSALLAGGPPVGLRMPDVVLTSPTPVRLYDLLGPRGLLLTAEPPQAGRSSTGLTVATMPPNLPKPFAGHADLLVRPDHLVGAVGHDRPLTSAQIATALGVARAARRGAVRFSDERLDPTFVLTGRGRLRKLVHPGRLERSALN